MSIEVTTVQIPSEATFGVALVSDTHSQPDERLAAHLKERSPSLLLHGGDIGNLSVLDTLSVHAPVLAVRGNIDGHGPDIPDARIIDFVRNRQRVLRVFLTHVAVYGVRLRSDVKKKAQAAGAQLVVCGHSHVPFLARDAPLLLCNPGSVGPRRYQLPIVFGWLSIAPTKIAIEHIDCETNTVWRPTRSAPTSSASSA